jgi:acyl-coenzyme A synthetase/AMP-(fatty) acid ligase
MPPNPRTLADHCRTHLSAHKVPVRFAFVKRLPKTASGKPDRTLPFGDSGVASRDAAG